MPDHLLRTDIDLQQVERRANHAMRLRVTELVGQGYSISGRDPLRLERGRVVLIVRGGMIINA